MNLTNSMILYGESEIVAQQTIKTFVLYLCITSQMLLTNALDLSATVGWRDIRRYISVINGRIAWFIERDKKFRMQNATCY